MRVKLFDLEILASFRGIMRAFPSQPIALLDIGANTGNLGIFTQRGLEYSCTIPLAGKALTENISQALAISIEEAENIKLREGISGLVEVRNALIPVLDRLIAEVRNNLEYFKEKNKIEVRDLLVLGGGSAA